MKNVGLYCTDLYALVDDERGRRQAGLSVMSQVCFAAVYMMMMMMIEKKVGKGFECEGRRFYFNL